VRYTEDDSEVMSRMDVKGRRFRDRA
jgi:hypothetical protein